MKSRHLEEMRRKIAHAVIRGRLPEEAIVWDIAEVVRTTVIVGSGESASWRYYVLIRLNGKQVWRDTAYCYTPSTLSEVIGRECLEAESSNRRTIYAVKP